LVSSFIDVEIRFYESLPVYRCVLCALTSGEKKCLISSYMWLPQFKTMAYSFSFVLDEKTQRTENGILYDLSKSWFNHYWGNSEIHTIIFDFDDTIVKTFDIQIEAWSQTIIKLLENKDIELDSCSNEICSAVNNYNELKQYVKRVYVEHQMASPIFNTLFPNITNNEGSKRQKIEEFRFKERQKLTIERSVLIENAASTIRSLKEKYQLVIISATSESLIKGILKKHGIDDCFSMILGKHGPKPDWENIYEKANLMIKLTKLVGIGLDRMVFIGDNDSDYRSAKQIQVKFIECRVIAKEENIGSMIRYIEQENEVYFDSYSVSQFETLLEKINNRLIEKKFLV